MIINRINSSKVYCKFEKNFNVLDLDKVLIVAKCIVNATRYSVIERLSSGINSSKVYCK